MAKPQHKNQINARFIAIEGIDGAGKTTQAKMLCDALRRDGFKALYLKEPTDGPYGRQIRALAQEGRDRITPMQEFELFLEDRKQDVAENILPALQSGTIVVIDRYFYSSIAYQGALGLDPEFINAENRKIAITPDLVIYLSIPADYAPSRIEKSRGDSSNLFEKLEYLKKVKANFDAMTYPEIRRIEGAGSVEEVHQKIYSHVRGLLEKK
ncbi:MAG TPA: dTMP kinase [Candidatus Sumerlaeia bacterium]|nr:MAG: Thymidylate kinase [candidate division BRC1 bacterium ADurb.Bin183]HRS00060.1 dTMP kinase [Candidatus Sumerlaeia bacterium]